MTRYTLYSGGQGSFRAAKVDRAQHPDADCRLVFTDTLYEDADTYRFLIESAVNVFGASLIGRSMPRLRRTTGPQRARRSKSIAAIRIGVRGLRRSASARWPIFPN